MNGFCADCKYFDDFSGFDTGACAKNEQRTIMTADDTCDDFTAA